MAKNIMLWVIALAIALPLFWFMSPDLTNNRHCLGEIDDLMENLNKVKRDVDLLKYESQRN